MGKKTQELKEKQNKKKKIFQYVISVIVVAFFIWIVIINMQPKKYNYTVSEDKMYYIVEGEKFKVSEKPTDYVLFIVDGYGAMVGELFADVAPITVANFKELVSEHFYDGLIFHRVINNFMIQTGDPTGTGSSGSGKTIKGEFDINGYKNTLSHTRGVLSMARLGPNQGEKESADTMNSASSQIFIVQADSTYLDGKYASFGQLLYGYEVLDEIAKVNTDSNDKPIKDVIIEKVIFLEET